MAAYALDEEQVQVVDTVQQGTLQRVPRASLEAARHAKGPMAARARQWTIAPPRRTVRLHDAIRTALRSNASAYLAPAFSGMGAAGIAKLAKSLPSWLTLSRSPLTDLQQTADLMERAGTGGSLFRRLYRDFVLEAERLLPGSQRALREALAELGQATAKWQRVAELIEEAGASRDPKPLQKAASICLELAGHEQQAMRALSRV